MTKAFAQKNNFLCCEFGIFSMIKHRNNKAKVFTITNTAICHSLRGNQGLAIELQQGKAWVHHLVSIYMDLMNLSEQEEILGFKGKNKM